jgi:hypothetical protein
MLSLVCCCDSTWSWPKQLRHCSDKWMLSVWRIVFAVIVNTDIYWRTLWDKNWMHSHLHSCVMSHESLSLAVEHTFLSRYVFGCSFSASQIFLIYLYFKFCQPLCWVGLLVEVIIAETVAVIPLYYCYFFTYLGGSQTMSHHWPQNINLISSATFITHSFSHLWKQIS